MDMWSIGCCLFEIATGKILFPGRTNNDMLYLFQQVTGPVSKKQRKGEFTHLHFDELGNFKRITLDTVSGKVSHLDD